MPQGYASPCPVWSVSPASVSQSQSLALTATPQHGTDYIYTTAYYALGSNWLPVTLTGNNIAPSYSTGLASGSLSSSILTTLPTGTNYIVLWDWLWDSTLQCYKGPGLNQCNTGTWRVQSFNLTSNTYTYSQSAYTGNCTGPFNILNQPSVNCRPYPAAYYNKKLPNAGSGGPMNHLMPGSDAMINTVMHNSGNLITTFGLWHTPGSDDFGSRPIYYGQASDPVYKVSGCTGNGAFVNGMTFHAPSGAQYAAYPNGTSDSDIIIWDQPSDTAFAFYTFGGGSLPACSGTSANPCIFTHNGNGYCQAAKRATGPGIQAGNVNTAGLAPLGTQTTLTEIKDAHHINHGFELFTWCDGTGNGQYPSRTVFPIGSGVGPGGGSSVLTCPQAKLSDTNRPPNGSLIYLDYTQAQLDCFDPTKASCGGINKLTTFQFEIVEAMTYYGGVLGGTGIGTGIGAPMGESEQAYQFYETNGYPGAQAIASSFSNFMDTNCTAGTCRRVTRSAPHSLVQWTLTTWAGISPVGGKDIAGHMHIANPCVTMAMQGVSGGCP